MAFHAESATMFVPGRTSYLDDEGILQLTDASQHRGEVAADVFDADYHDYAVFAGGYPGVIARRFWPQELMPSQDRREGILMASPLQKRLLAEGYTPDQVSEMVRTQNASSDSIGDVIESIEQGLLVPDHFNRDNGHGLDLVTGFLHGVRERRLLSVALDMDPARIHRVPMRDVYGTPAYPHQPGESCPVAIAKECAGIALTELVLRNVKPGDIDSLRGAQDRLLAMIEKEVAA